MVFNYTGLGIVCESSAEKYAAGLFALEVEKRTGVRPREYTGGAGVRFITCDTRRLPSNDCYEIVAGDTLDIYAHGVRGFIFGYSLFLRRCVFEGEKITLTEDITGKYVPKMSVRGHQIGYRTTPNTYDAWDYEQYFHCYLDMMAFGCNTCEHIPYENGKSNRNSLMRYDEEEFLVEASRMADTVDMDVSLWFPNNSNETEEEALERRRKLFKRLPRLNVVFPPGGDPGELYADDFVERCRKISAVLKESHPEARMFPSAQKPHEYPDWGFAFIEALEELPEEIDGVIMGPNHAFPLFELRKRLPSKYPLRFYPDITHNVRCEYPVHYLNDDWHYAVASVLSRECVNPRPTEYRTLHRQTRNYMIGSVSYSEGVSDDVNKCVWSDMDFFGECDLRKTLLDYARFFFWGSPADEVADGIFALELNWQGDPAENPSIDNAYRIFRTLGENNPELKRRWRYNMCMLRAICDKLVRMRRLFENGLIDRAQRCLEAGETQRAYEILMTPYPDEYNNLRAEPEALAKTLFEQIGIQLDVEHYHANSWERGATLETLDQPVTDKKWLLNRLAYAQSLPEDERGAFIKRLLSRNSTDTDEFYWSLALHGFEPLNQRPEGEFYINFQGDRPGVNDGRLPMSMLKVYDHYKLCARLGGFKPGADYFLRVTYSSNKIQILNHHRVVANGTVIYDGPQYGGERDEQFDREMLCSGFESATYTIPAEVFVNGTLELEIGEPNAGVMLSELWLIKKE